MLLPLQSVVPDCTRNGEQGRYTYGENDDENQEGSPKRVDIDELDLYEARKGLAYMSFRINAAEI